MICGRPKGPKRAAQQRVASCVLLVRGLRESTVSGTVSGWSSANFAEKGGPRIFYIQICHQLTIMLGHIWTW